MRGFQALCSTHWPRITLFVNQKEENLSLNVYTYATLQPASSSIGSDVSRSPSTTNKISAQWIYSIPHAPVLRMNMLSAIVGIVAVTNGAGPSDDSRILDLVRGLQ
jgi:hypothetical protein